MRKITLILSLFFIGSMIPPGVWGWSWNSADNVMPSLREELDKEIAAYRQQVGNGLPLQERILLLDRLVNNYKPLGLNVVELETERTRLMLQVKQQQLRSSELQDEANLLYEKGVAEYRDGYFQTSYDTFQEAERLLPEDTSIKELRRKLQGLTPIIESEVSTQKGGRLIRLAVRRYLENDPKRALNALIFAMENDKDRRGLTRLKTLIENNTPEVELPRIPKGISIIDHKLQLSLEAIYDGRYLTAIAECTDVLDLEPKNVLGLTRLGSAYFAMNEQKKASQIWTKALQLDPENNLLRKFLYGKTGKSRVETSR